MSIKKITTGFVIQTYNEDTGDCIGQEFIAGDQVDYEDEQGESCKPFAAYFPFDMIQPETKINVSEKVQEVIHKRADILLQTSSYRQISGSYCHGKITDEFINGWEVEFILGILDDTTEKNEIWKEYLQKNTYCWTDDEEDVCLEPE